MKNIFLLLVLALLASLATAPKANADDGKVSGREIGLFSGGGLFRASEAITVMNSKSTFNGWGGEILGGLDLPWGDKFGTSFSVAYRYADTENNGSNFSEDGTLNSVAAKAEFYFGVVALGGGLSKDWLKVHTVSTTNGTIDGTYSGERPFVSASVNYNIKQVFRLGIGGDYSFGKLNGYTATGWTLGLSVGVLF